MKLFYFALFLNLFSISLMAASHQPDVFPVPLQKARYFEQSLIGIRDTSKDTLDPNYQPEQGLIFDVPTYWVDRDLFEIKMDEASFPAELKKIIFRKYNGHDQFLISVHPEGMDYYPNIIGPAEKGIPFVATASASPRSLITVAKQDGIEVGFYNKLSLNKRLGGNVRLIHKQELARSFFVTQLLSGSKNLPPDFGYYSEFMVFIPKNADLGGTILRSLPPEVQSGEVTHIPVFALYADQPNGAKPILLQMAEAAGMPVDQFLQEKIQKPFLKQWMTLALDQGISMEPHGQNLLVEVNKAGQLTGRFFHRDFGGFTIDVDFRKSKGLYLPEPSTINGYTAEYNASDVGYGLKTSLDFYFANIIDRFGARYEEWFRRGWVTRDLKKSDFQASLIRDTERAFSQKTGKQISLTNHLANIMQPVLDSRRSPGAFLCRSIHRH
jgi:hypothetical protein